MMLGQKRSKLKGTPPTLQVKSSTEDKTITDGSSCFLLGGTLQSNLSWQGQIDTGENYILPKLKSRLGAIKYCCKKLPEGSRRLLATGLVISKLVYLLPVYGGTCKKYLDKLQVVLNNTARFVTGIGKRVKKVTLINATGWLVIYHSVLQMWRVTRLKVPQGRSH